MSDSGNLWYDCLTAVGATDNPSSNADMISPAFWLARGSELHRVIYRFIDVKFIFDSARLGLFSSANILQIADVALRVVFLLFLPCF